MRLVSAYIQGYKRFGEKSRLLVDGDVTALVGPNEAGKSAVLEALTHIEQEDQAFPEHTLTRGAEPGNQDTVVELLFKLEEDDFKGVYPAPAEKPIWFELRQRRDGYVEREVKPTVPRSQQLRPGAEAAAKDLIADAKRALQQEPVDGGLDEEEEERELTPLERLIGALAAVRGKIDVHQDDLADEVRAQLTEAHELLDSEEIILEMERPEAKAELQAAAIYESANHLQELADQLETQRPRFLYIPPKARELAGSYLIAEIEANEDFPGLHNLATMGGITIADYLHANQTNAAKAKGLEQAASQRISKRLTEAWEQADDVTVDFEIYTGQSLSILVSTSGPEGFHEASERSAGMRAFISLVAAVDAARQGQKGRPIILLLEHPEHDLHIDAQADLIRVLEEQVVAQQVIYTTHSPAALPTDIAANTRAVVMENPKERPDRSRFAASFSEDDAGFTPLQLVMGAGSAAFTPARRAVIGEGLTEVYLLPSLFREVMGIDRLEFQVAPGGAHMNKDTARRVNSDAAHVAFLVDGDDGGRRVAAVIRGAGIEPGHIVVIGREKSELNLEDLLDQGLYIDAVNEELRLKRVDLELTLDDLDPELGRIASVERVCVAKGVEAPEKPAIARRCLELSKPTEDNEEGRLLVAETGRDVVRTMFEELMAIVDPR